jgi:hypothetical protein
MKLSKSHIRLIFFKITGYIQFTLEGGFKSDIFLNIRNFCEFCFLKGELPERSNGADSKSVVPFGVPGVRIPHSPLFLFAGQQRLNPVMHLSILHDPGEFIRSGSPRKNRNPHACM